MSYQTPTGRSAAVDDVLEAIRPASRVVLTTHINADGDGAGSQVALASWLRDQGKEAWIVNPTPFPRLYTFLVPDQAWLLDAASQEAKEICQAADLAVVVDTGEVHRIGRVKPMVESLPTVVIDHHPAGDAPFGGVSFRVSEACAAGELVYDLLLRAECDWSPPILDGIYVAVLTDTGGFQFSNSTPACHRLGADLIERGVDPEDLYRRIYGSTPLKSLLLLGASLSGLQVDPDGGMAWMTVPRSLFDELGATAEYLEGMANYPRSVQGVEVGLVFNQTDDGSTKVSFRSNGDLDVNALARAFGGGGHVRASGARVTRPLAEVREEVLKATRDALDRMGGE